MWKRRTFHECAAELDQLSDYFRHVLLDEQRSDEERERELAETSVEGVELLRILALAIRTEQDTSLTSRPSAPVGAIVYPASKSAATALVKSYRPPYATLSTAQPLDLRSALNKIAHVEPESSGFYADANSHDLLLVGSQQKTIWLAVLSIPTLCRVVMSLPDRQLRK